MHPKITNLRKNSIRSQRGIGLIVAIFVITTLSIIVATIHNLNELTAKSYGKEWNSLHAQYAAESGVQIATVLFLSPSLTTPLCTTNMNAQELTGSGFYGCQYILHCKKVVINHHHYYIINSEGQCGSGIDRASRIVQTILFRK